VPDRPRGPIVRRREGDPVESLYHADRQPGPAADAQRGPAAGRQGRRRGLQPGLYRAGGAAGADRLCGVRAKNPDLWRFAWTTNVNVSLTLVWRQLPVLVVGRAGTPAVTGGYRIAANLVNALSKPAPAQARAMRPEPARLAVSERWTMARIARQAARATGPAGLAGVGVMALLGHPALGPIDAACATVIGATVIGAIFLLAMLFARYRRVLHRAVTALCQTVTSRSRPGTSNRFWATARLSHDDFVTRHGRKHTDCRIL